jgi:hypothetical protein
MKGSNGMGGQNGLGGSVRKKCEEIWEKYEKEVPVNRDCLLFYAH